MDRSEKIVIPALVFAILFLIAGYLKENDMRIHLTFAGHDNKTHHVEGEWPSTQAAINWAKEQFKALTGFARSI